MIDRKRRRLRDERATLLASLRESEARFEAMANSAPVLLWVADADGASTWFNEAWLKFTGRAIEDELGDGWATGIHPDDRERCLHTYRTAIRSRAPYEMEFRLRRHDGVYRWVLDRGMPRLAPDGTPEGFIGSCSDVTEQREALESSQRRERQKELVANLGRRALEEGFTPNLLDEACRVIASVSDAIVEIWESVQGETLELRARIGEGPVVSRALAAHTLRVDEPVVSVDFSAEDRFDASELRAAGLASGTAVVLRTDAGPYGVLAACAREPGDLVASDAAFLRNVGNVLGATITRARIETELRLRELESSLVFAIGRVGAWRWDPDADRVWWSPEMERVYGLVPGSFGGTFDDFMALVHPDDRADVHSVVADAASSGEEFTFEHRAVRPDGEVRWLDSRGARIETNDGRFHWIGVGIDVTGRKRADQELRERELEARVAFSAGRMGSWRWNTSTNTGSWSPELQALMGLEPGDFDGHWSAFLELLVDEDRAPLRAAAERAVEADEELVASYRVRRRSDGALRWLESRGRRVAGNEWVGVTLDVTDRKAAEVQLEEAYRQLEETVARLDALLDYATVGFAFFDADLRFIRLNQVVAEMNGLPIDALLGQRMEEALPDLWARLGSWLGHVLESGEPLVDVEISRLPGASGIERHWLGSFYPVRSTDGRPLGLGSVIVEITQRKRQEQEARLMAAVGELYAVASDLDATLHGGAEIAVPELCDSCALYVFPRAGLAGQMGFAIADDELGDELRAAEGRWPLDVEKLVDRVAPDDSAYLLDEVTPGLIADAFDADGERRALIEAHGAVSAVVAPLRASGREIGVAIFTTTPTSGRRLQEADVGTGQELARRLAQVIDNVYLAIEAAKAQARLDLFAQVGELLTVELDSEARLRAVAEVVLPTLADIAAVFLKRDDDLLELVAFASDDETLQQRFDRADVWPKTSIKGLGPVGTAFRRMEPILIREVEPGMFDEALRDPDIGEIVRAIDIRSVLAAPLSGPEGAIGVMAFGYTGSGRRYSEDDVPLVRELARRMAPALENALRFERQTEAAEALQRSLLPQTLPRLHGADLVARYLPGTVGIKVGGDWYDAIPIDDGRVMLAIGDVVGHGVRAAASMGRIRNVLQFCALDGLAPAAILDRLNRYLCGLADSDMATLLVATYDPATRALRFSTAGHLPAIVHRPNSPAMLLEGARGLPLCTSTTARYQEAECRLEAGAVLTLYTDGLIERRGESLDAGFDRLTAALEVGPDDLDALADHLVEQLVGHTAQADDVALLLLRPRGGPRDLELRCVASPRELGHVRRAVGEWLATLGVGRVQADEVVVSVNEVAANSIEHAYGLDDAEFVVTGREAGGVLEVVVRDFGRWRTRSSGDDRGRGLELARRLMDEVEVATTTEGTTVTLRRRPQDGS